MFQKTTLFRCPICGATEHKILKAFAVGVIVGKCNACGTIYTPQRDNEPEKLFGNRSYEEQKFLYDPIIKGKVKHFRHRNFHQYLSIVKKYTTGKKMLDVGCAHGFFPFFAKNDGLDVSAIEPDEPMYRFAKEELNIDIQNGVLNQVDLGDQFFDIITLTDALEYFINPIDDLSSLRNHLNDKGIVFIKVPNGNYFRMRNYLDKKLKRNTDSSMAFTPPKRVAHYTKHTLKLLLEKAGYKAITVKHIAPVDSPLWFNYTGLWLEYEHPKCFGRKQRFLRRFLHFLGKTQGLFTGRNHFSQSVYIVAGK